MNVKKAYARIKGTGSYLPDKIITNADLEKMVDTSDEWIITRTGIKERRISEEGQATSDLATIAAINACKNANIKPEEIELILVATITPDMPFPSTACFVQKNIGAINAACFDIQAACTGFIYAITVAAQFIENNFYKNALVIGADTLSKLTNWEDRNTCVLFSDGAGAVVLEKDISRGFIGAHLASDGTGSNLLYCPGGGSRYPATHDTIDKKLHYTIMEGSEVFKFAVRALPEAVEKVLKNNDINIKDVSWLIPHQANIRIIDAASKKLDIDKDKVIITLEKYGNNSSASIPIALDEYINNNSIREGDIIVMVGFGSGLTYGAVVIKM